jgi:hypothetical protein
MGDELDFEALVASLKENPEKALELELDDEALLKLQKKLDPYAGIAGPARDEAKLRVAALSYTNITQDYATRFAVTSTIGFLWRMLAEWKIDPERRRWKPAKIRGEVEPFSVGSLECRAVALTELVAILKQKQIDFDAACDKVQKRSEALILTEEEMQQVKAAESGEVDPSTAAEGPAKIKEMQELFKLARDAEDEYHGVLYTTTLELRTMGVEADHRLPKTEATAMKHPKSRAAIKASPNRNRGILPGGQQEVPEKLAQTIISDFLSNYLEFNPDAHVRKAYDETVIVTERKDVAGLPDQVLVDPHDPTRLPLKTLLEVAPPETTVVGDQPHLKAMVNPPSYGDKQRNYNVLCHLLRDEGLADAARYILGGAKDDPDRQERWRRMLIPTLAVDAIPVVPPQDTFHRLQFYMDANFESLRAATETIYHEKPYLDFALCLMDHSEGPPQDVQDWGRAFRDREQDNVISDIKVVEFGAWTWLGEFEANRQAADIFNRSSDILKRILDRCAEDKKLGSLLMRQRVRKAKAENIRKDGPDAPGLAAYKEANPLPGGKEVLSLLERKRLEKTRGNLKAARELAYYEEYEEKIQNLESRAKLGELTHDEKAELKDAYEELEKAKEMVEVPDNAIQVDVWETGTDGKMTRSKMYTRAADVGGTEDETLAMANIEEARERQAKQAAAKLELKKKHPLEFYPKGSRDKAAQAFVEGKSTPALAPFAQDYYAKEVNREAELAAEAEKAEASSLAVPAGKLATTVDQLLDTVAEK